jgi:hypothetical protein
MTENASSKKIRIKYEKREALFANQVILNGTPEELFLDFSSGPTQDAESGETVVPIHTRIAMTPAGARRLLAALQQSFQRGEQRDSSE